MRNKLIAGNWKLNPATSDSALELCRQLKLRLAPFSKAKIVVCPPFTALCLAVDLLKGTRISIGAQNLYWEDSGAYTGEISAPMLKSAGCEYVIIGHSERRLFFHETNENVHHKIIAAQRHNLIPIVCVGETLQQRESGVMKDVVMEQVTEALRGMSEQALQNLVIAYEPVWAIGTGKTATPAQAEEMHEFIRSLILEDFTKSVSDQMLILYGGSVKPDNARDLLQNTNIDGALVGGACLSAESFSEIVRAGEELL
ncbi:MAG: triose-phosphate isomerase [bacterium]|nr:triose-phosphate isomerase [bacterium]